MAQYTASRSGGFPNFLNLEIKGDSLTPAIVSQLNQAWVYFNNYDNYDQSLQCCYQVLHQAKNGNIELKFLINLLYFISKCHLEKREYDEATKCIEKAFKLMLTVCPGKIDILHRFIIKIEEQRGNYVEAFILSILFKEQTRLEYDGMLIRLKTLLVGSMTKNGPVSIQKIFYLLLNKGKSFLLANENSIAIAVFNEILELLNIVECKETLKDELSLKIKDLIEKATPKSTANQAKNGVANSRSTHYNSQLPQEPAWEGLPPPPREFQNHRSEREVSPVLQTSSKNNQINQAKAPGNRENGQNSEDVADDKSVSENSQSEMDESGCESISEVASSLSTSEENSYQNTPCHSENESLSSIPNETPFQTVTKREKNKSKHNTAVLPEGVEAICQHFMANSTNIPTSNNRPKVCKGCESRCFYAFWSTKFNKWHRVRPYPSYLRHDIPFKACFIYNKGRPCENGCTHAHGPELQMWNMQREQVRLPSPESWLKNTTSKTQPSLSKNARKREGKREKRMQADAAVAQQSTTPRSSSSSNNTKVLQPQTIPTTFPAQQNYLPQTHRSSSSSNNTNVSQPQTIPTTFPEQQTASPQTCYLPKEVKIICMHFMRDFGKTPQGNQQRINVCKKCGLGPQQNSIKYGFWSAKSNHWFFIKDRPLGVAVHVAFQACKQFIRGDRCLKKPCTFGHGPEVMVWTMDREGVLVSPEKAFRDHLYIKDERSRVTRPLPAGVIDGTTFKLCQSVQLRRSCRFGRGCRNAHSETELSSWCKEYKQQMNKQQQQQQQQQQARSTLLPRQTYKVTESMPGVKLSCQPENPNVILNEADVDVHEHEWTFHIHYETSGEKRLPCVFLGERYCGHYRLKSVQIHALNKSTNLMKSHTANINDKLFCKPSDISSTQPHKIAAEVVVQFHASVFGSFTQRILFDFGTDPVLMKEFNIDVISCTMEDTLPQLVSAREELSQERFRFNERDIVRMEPLEDESLFGSYSLPSNPERLMSAQMVEGGQIRRDTYIHTMHQVLFAEEAHMRNLLSKLTPSDAKLSAKKSYTHSSQGLKFAESSYFFGSIELQANVTPDDKAGRVCIRKVNTVLLQARDGSTLLYEAPIDFLEENKVTVKLFPKLCEDFKIERENQEIDVRMGFNINRTILCRMHKSLDSLNDTHKRILFPEKQATIPHSRDTKESHSFPWLQNLMQSLNEDQLRVIQAITDTISSSQPLPLVVFGPFGTGKTYTLNKAILLLVTKQSNRVLVCTHTNSAADIHVELLHKYLVTDNALKAATPLRIVDPQRKISTISNTVRKYTLVEDNAFVMPTRTVLNQHRVVITTLTTADYLTKLNANHGHFTHILIDEAAQAWETEALIPVALAGPNTKIVLTGDHMQMSPEVYTKFPCQWGLRMSLPERLFDHYNQMDDTQFINQHVMYLTFNYRSNKDILEFPSHHCYDDVIVAMGDEDNPPHPDMGPMMFYSSKGKDEKQPDNTYFNEAEVSEVVKRVKQLADTWPAEFWGEKNLKEIAVLAPYLYQVKAIRAELRKRRLTNVTVDTIHNVQGKEFRALFISTVRTRNSVKGSSEDIFLEFLSDPKLLITAVTRAKSLVAVVGDPVSLCSLGECQSLWKDFIQRCHNLGKLHGTTIEYLEKEIQDISVAHRRLNPEAPCFVPETTGAESQDENEVVVEQEMPDDLQAEADSKADDSSISNDAESDAFEEEYQARGEELRYDVLPIDFDEIVQAFKKYKDSKVTQASSVEMEEEEKEEWPSLPGPSSSRGSRIASAEKEEEDEEWPCLPGRSSSEGTRIITPFPTEKRPIFTRLPSSDYEMRREYGRDEIRLIELNNEPSERGQPSTGRTRVSRPEHLSTEVLLRMLEENPSRYLIGQLRVGVDGRRNSFVEIPDRTTCDVKIRGDVRPAFDKDTVVLDKEKIHAQANPGLGSNKSDCVIGILNHLIDPRERQYVCKLDPFYPWLMIPINKSVTKIANLIRDRPCPKIPVYKKIIRNNYERASYKVQRMVDPKDAKKNKYLFVVQFLQWRSDCYYPLGCVRRTITQKETVEDGMKIIDAEYGVRRAVSNEIQQEVRKSFPPDWKIPELEMQRRRKVNNPFTIDPTGSNDLDDAVSVEEMDDGNCKVGIHIADVSYFVKPGSEVDEDARQRGSTYYPGVSSMENIPMLPRELSENHCSLLERRDRLTQSVYVILDRKGEVVQSKTEHTVWPESTVTHSLCRLTYSEAQNVIEGEDLDKPQIPEEDKRIVQESILLLHSLMQNLRRRRLGNGHHSQDERNDTAAHELIEEMMILANRTVGTILRVSTDEQNHPGTVPFVCQLEPKVHRLNQWATKYGRFAKYLPSTRKYLQSDDIEEDIRKRLFPTEVHREEHIDILKPRWRETREAAASGRLPMLEFLICDPHCSPQLHLASKHLRSTQRAAEYKCSREEVKHHSLSISDYVHFTSPIRRYMDIEIHRRLKAEAVDTDTEQVEKFCRRSTFIKQNSRKFEKECKRLSFSHSLKGNASNPGIEAYVDEVENHSFAIHPRDPEQDLLSRNRRISIDDLSVDSKTELQPDDDKREMTLTWIVRVYVSPSLEESRSGVRILHPVNRERKKMENILLPAAHQESNVCRIEGEKWLQLIGASVKKDRLELENLIEVIGQAACGDYYDSPIKVKPYLKGGHYYKIEMKLKQFDIVHVQLFSHLSRDVLCPDIQLFKISNFGKCLEHRRLPRRCFAKDHHHPASKQQYTDIDNYIKHWEPVLAMETATQAVSQTEGYILKSHRIQWRRIPWTTGEGEEIKGTFTLQESFCKSRQLVFEFGDFACVRIPQYEDESKDSQAAETPRAIWVGHCIVKNVEKNRENEIWNVELVMNHGVSDMPDEFLDGNFHSCDLEIIYQPVPGRRMTLALNSKLIKSSELVKSICLGHMPTEGGFKVPDKNLSLSQHYSNSGFEPLNEYQETAVKHALQDSFSMIQGPPGTGKTVTGVHIAYWFAKQNLELMKIPEKEEMEEENDDEKSYFRELLKSKKGDLEDEETETPSTNAPPQVLYCGPSNKSVDVVTEYLLRIPDMKDKILRVYGSLIVEKEYPIANKITRLKPLTSDDQLKIPKDHVKDVALHHFIRSTSSPYAEKLRQFENQFRQAQDRPNDENVETYRSTIAEAEHWAIENAGKEIILCTCSMSGSKLIREKCNILQCIVDECGMTMEPEVLVPLTSSNAQQIVLIGDHKQLQPIVIDRQAQKLDLACSMFERLSKRAERMNKLMMLKIQYRMHSSICDFPSMYFYDNKLETADTVKSRVENADFWPATKYGNPAAIVFCHVDGSEKSTAMSTADSGVESKYNEAEADKAVQIAKLLVNKYKTKKADVVILTPYREQRKIIADRLKGAYEDINVTTIIKSQGSEWDYVIISLVRSLPDTEIDDDPSGSWLGEHIGFVANEHQINVALTRAKNGLCVIGNKKLLSLNKTWANLLQHYEERHCVVDGKQWP